MHTVVETPAYLRHAKDADVDAKERAAIVDILAKTPDAGQLIPGTGGTRKLRFAGKGKGKSGGYRVITFYSAEDMPVFLITIFAKGQRVDLTQNERNSLRALTKTLVDNYRKKSRL